MKIGVNAEHRGRHEARQRRRAASSASGGTIQATASEPAAARRRGSAGPGEPHAARDLDRGQDREQHAGEHERVDEPRRAEEQCELDDALRLEQQERGTHEEEVDVRAHPRERARPTSERHQRCDEDQRQRHQVEAGNRCAPWR